MGDETGGAIRCDDLLKVLQGLDDDFGGVFAIVGRIKVVLVGVLGVADEAAELD